MMVHWNIPSIFAAAGGTAGLIEICRAEAPLQIPPTPTTVGMWKFRGRIAHDWMPSIIRALIRKGFRVEDLTVLAPTLPFGPAPSRADLGL